MFDSVSSGKNITSQVQSSSFGVQQPAKQVRFADVLAAVEAATDVPPKVRDNMRTAVNRFANLMSAQALSGPVIITEINKKLEHLTAAMLGMKTANGLAGIKSNFRRALRLAGLDVMPGRHVTPLSPAWQRLLARLGTDRMSIKLSRFAHVASEHGWEPEDIGPGHLHRFHILMKTTNVGSKADRVVRETVNAWSYGRAKIAEWPQRDLGRAPGRDRFYIMPWSDFPETFRADIESFITRKGPSFDDDLERIVSTEDDLLRDESHAERKRKVLKEATKENYRNGFRRIASILVNLGRPASRIGALADIVTVDNTIAVIRHLRGRLGKNDGGHISYLAFLMYFAARDHVNLNWQQVDHLEEIWRKVRGEFGKMSRRSFDRLVQFDDENCKHRMADLPNKLATAARRLQSIDARSIRLMRTAVFVAIGLDTAMRSGNIVSLTLDRHITLHRAKKKWLGEILVPGHEVKNGVEIISPLQPETVALIREWIADYRPLVLKEKGAACQYLFPNEAGGHLCRTMATESMKDLGGKYAGLDVTPHVMRSYMGKVILDESPDAHAQVQELLGHKSLKTTVSSYAPVRQMQARQRSQRLLMDLRSRK